MFVVVCLPSVARDFSDYVEVRGIGERVTEVVEEALTKILEQQTEVVENVATRTLEQRVEDVVTRVLERKVENVVARVVENHLERRAVGQGRHATEGRMAEQMPNYTQLAVRPPMPSSPFEKLYVNGRSKLYHHEHCRQVNDKSDELRPCDKCRKHFKF